MRCINEVWNCSVLRATLAGTITCAHAAPFASAELIRPESAALDVISGGTGSTIIILDDSVTPLFGYSLELKVVPLAGAVGSVTIDAAASSFFDSRNLITAAGLTRDPVFSVLQSTPSGMFLSTNTSDLSTITAVPGVNDALAQVVFRASPDAAGQFELRFADGTALSDGQGFAVGFTSDVLTITVVIPTPGVLAIAACGGAIVCFGPGRRRPSAGRGSSG